MVIGDEKLLIDCLRYVLASAPGIEVPDACEEPHAVAQVMRHRPDVLLVAQREPGTDELTALSALRECPDPPAVAVLAADAEEAQVTEALRLGVSGYLLKDAAPSELIDAVRVLASGSIVLSPAVAGTALADRLSSARPDAVEHRQLSALTKRELQVLVLLPKGLSNAQIARRLFMSPATVKDYISSILAKLHLSNRVQAAVFASQISPGMPAFDIPPAPPSRSGSPAYAQHGL